MLTTQQQQKIIQSLLKKPQNHLCSDCNCKSPCWASLDFGVFVCMNCSGAHRALGPSITRVRSTKLDTWKTQWVENMTIGNSNLNKYWENQLPSSDMKPNVNTSLVDIKKYVMEKYIKKKYIDHNQQFDPLTRLKKGIMSNSQNQKCNKQIKSNQLSSNNKSNASNNKIPQKIIKQNSINMNLLKNKKPLEFQYNLNIKNMNSSKKTVQLIDFDFDFSAVTQTPSKINTSLNNINSNNQINNESNKKNQPITFNNFLQNVTNNNQGSNSNIKAHENHFINYNNHQNGLANNNNVNGYMNSHLNQNPNNLHSFSVPATQLHPNLNNMNNNIYQSHYQNPHTLKNHYPNAIQYQSINTPQQYQNSSNTNNKTFQFNDFFTNNVNRPNNNITLQVTLNNNIKEQKNKQKNWVDQWM